MEAKLIDSMGTDSRVVDAARVSFSKLASEYTEEQNEKLITYLAKHSHFTPFTHPQITIHEKVPIFVARQRFKHTIGFSYNEVSRRYVDDEPEFYTPEVWRGRPEGSMKQGSSEKEINIKWVLAETAYGDWDYDGILFLCEKWYNKAIEAGVAPEQARMVLPQSAFTEYYVTGSLAAWARAYRLRSDSHAQLEIQELAKQWNSIIEPLFPISWKALTKE